LRAWGHKARGVRSPINNSSGCSACFVRCMQGLITHSPGASSPASAWSGQPHPGPFGIWFPSDVV
jgi:hypothetical protein